MRASTLVYFASPSESSNHATPPLTGNGTSPSMCPSLSLTIVSYACLSTLTMYSPTTFQRDGGNLAGAGSSDMLIDCSVISSSSARASSGSSPSA